MSDVDLTNDPQWGRVRGRDIDPTFPTVSFTDPVTGEELEPEPQTVHQVPVGTNSDGSVKTAPMTDFFAGAQPDPVNAKEADMRGSRGRKDDSRKGHKA